MRGDGFVISDKVHINHPTVGSICDYGEQEYYDMVKSLCATPSDCKVALADLKMDFTQVKDFELFTLRCDLFTKEQTRILFGDSIDFSNMYLNEVNGEKVIEDPLSGVRVDESTYHLMIDFLRRIHMFERHVDNPGNEYTKNWMIEKARKLMKRGRGKPYESMLVPLVSSMVNCNHFKYKHHEVWDLPIYVFMDSVKRILKIKSCDQLTQGIYAGTVDAKKISNESLNWLGALK